MTIPFRAAPRPDSEVVELLERCLEAARRGRIKAVAISAVNPINEAEHLIAGDLSTLRCNSLIAGLVRATLQVTSTK